MKKQRSVVSGQQSVAAVLEPGAVAALNEWGDAGVAGLPVPAPALGEVVRVDQVEEIELDLLVESPLNPRRTYDEKALNELAGSIRAIGITQPLIVRPRRAVTVIFGDGSSESAQGSLADCSHLVGHPLATETEVDDCYELITGRRRAEAARLIGRATAPCIVRELSDEQAADIALIDNLQRADVEPLEEAAGFADLVARHGSVAAVAARVGKDVAHVTKRLKLLTLTLDVRDALTLRLITVDHALLITKLGAEEQGAALKWCLDRNAGVKTDVADVVKQCAARRDQDAADRTRSARGYVWEPESVIQLKGHIESSSGRKLKTAPWPLDDAGLIPDVGSCSACPSNTKANNLLFGDLDMDAATCTDGGCFEAKTKAFVQLKRVEATPEPKWTGGVSAETHERVSPKPDAPLSFSWKFSSVQPRWDKNTARLSLTQIFKAGQWIEAKKGSCEHARLGVATDWEDEANRGHMGSSQDKHRKPGAELLICVEPKCKAHPKEWEKTKEPPVDRNGNSAANKLKAEEHEKLVDAENAIRAEQVKLAIAKVKTLSGSLLRRVALAALPHWLSSDHDEAFPGLEKGLSNLKVESPEFARAAASTLFIGQRWPFIHTHMESVAAGRVELIKLLKDLGHDASKAWEKPKSSGQRTADSGQPKKPAKKAAKAAPKKAAKKSVKKAVRK